MVSGGAPESPQIVRRGSQRIAIGTRFARRGSRIRIWCATSRNNSLWMLKMRSSQKWRCQFRLVDPSVLIGGRPVPTADPVAPIAALTGAIGGPAFSDAAPSIPMVVLAEPTAAPTIPIAAPVVLNSGLLDPVADPVVLSEQAFPATRLGADARSPLGPRSDAGQQTSMSATSGR